ncbi:MAG: SDR family oxidoreductase [Acidimicrobiia bacterium]|nr:SDR family oxidoreductase [Acidimicrobiia bacterium]
MSGRMAGKVAVITGAGQGIGRATALAYANEGGTVWAVDLNPDSLSDLQHMRPDVRTAVLDVTDQAGVARLADEVGGVDVLFNCAGYVHAGGIEECTEAEWDAAMEVNVKSMFLVSRAFLPHMESGACIINMASVVSSISGVPGRLAYGASKAAVIGLTKAMAADLVDRGIRCNAIAPGTVDSPSLADRLAAYDDPEAARAQFVARQRMGRLGTAEEVAALAVYLGSDESAYTTGSVHVIDGGMTL